MLLHLCLHLEHMRGVYASKSFHMKAQQELSIAGDSLCLILSRDPKAKKHVSYDIHMGLVSCNVKIWVV